jgi:hypothetical protein
MHAAFFEIFCLRLAAGLALALLCLPSEAVNPRFHRIQLVIVLGLAVAAAVFAWNEANDGFFLGIGIAVGACVIGSLFWTVRFNVAGVAAVLAVVGGLLGALTALRTDSTAGSSIWMLLEDFSAAAVLGIGTTAMLMGHWYLIAPTMSLVPLLRLILALFAALAVRMLISGVDLGSALLEGVPFDALAWMWLGLRWGVGFVGVAGLNWMAWQTARMRSTQSATGILYVVTIFCFFGELTDQLLQEHLLELARGLG